MFSNNFNKNGIIEEIGYVFLKSSLMNKKILFRKDI